MQSPLISTCEFLYLEWQQVPPHKTSSHKAKEIRQQYFTKLPEPFSTKIIKDWNDEGLTDTLGSRINFLYQWFM